MMLSLPYFVIFLFTEAMKMQNLVVAQATGKIKAIHVAVGNTVTNGDVLVEME